MRGRSLLDRILRCLKDPSTAIRMEALLFFQTMMGQLKRKEASPIALLLAQKLPALFGDESSQVQELSLSLFGDTMKAMVSRDKAEMKEAIRGVVVSLFLHMNAESRSVAEASGKTLLICAKFLGWRKLKRVIKKGKNWMIGETLLKQDRSRVEDYVCFSLHYLWDSQAGVRMEAIRFIGEPQPWGPSSGSPAPAPGTALAPGAALLLSWAGPWPPAAPPALPCPGLSGLGGRLAQCQQRPRGLARGHPRRVLGRRACGRAGRAGGSINSLEYDPDPSVRSLAAQTLHILQSVREPKRSRWSFPGLCFC
ncbi:uncharacterized protein [Heliangelus exortis]|uniref:uncharacterized protein n=1 Tax=Heliangelus exortis TaxID=472823 RepID=UPI003A92BF7C